MTEQLLHAIIIIINGILELQVVPISIHHGIHILLKHMVKCDETLCELLNIEDELVVRSKFCELLDKEVCYLFILIHHENKHIIDYTDLLGEKL